MSDSNKEDVHAGIEASSSPNETRKTPVKLPSALSEMVSPISIGGTTSSIVPPPRLLAATRGIVGISQKELTIAAGLATSVVGRYEAGICGIIKNTLERILLVLKSMGVRFVVDSQEIEMGVVHERSLTKS